MSAAPTRITEAERTALRDPKVSRGARIEAEYRSRVRSATGHAELLDYLEALAEAHGPDLSDAELLATAIRVFAPA